MKKMAIGLILLSMSFPALAQNNPSMPKPRRTVQDASDVSPRFDEPDAYQMQQPIKENDTTLFGAQVQFYYDALSNYYKTITSGTLPPQFGYQSVTGMGGMQILFAAITRSKFEISTGFDYGFPVNVQGAQSINGYYAVTSQTFNVMGFKVLQVGFHFPAAQFTVVPYGGVGIY